MATWNSYTAFICYTIIFNKGFLTAAVSHLYKLKLLYDNIRQWVEMTLSAFSQVNAIFFTANSLQT